jgi:hypothetical protein
MQIHKKIYQFLNEIENIEKEIYIMINIIHA